MAPSKIASRARFQAHVLRPLQLTILLRPCHLSPARTRSLAVRGRCRPIKPDGSVSTGYPPQA